MLCRFSSSDQSLPHADICFIFQYVSEHHRNFPMAKLLLKQNLLVGNITQATLTITRIREQSCGESHLKIRCKSFSFEIPSVRKINQSRRVFLRQSAVTQYSCISLGLIAVSSSQLYVYNPDV